MGLLSLIITEPYRSKHNEYLTNYLKTGIKKVLTAEGEFTGKRKNGDQYTFTAIVRDVTTRFRTQKAKDAAESVIIAKSKFLFGTHES